jgi:hypothetical protein
MDLERFLNLLAAVFGAMGSIYTLKGVAALSPDLIERLSRTYWDLSSAQIDALTGQKADAIVGVVLVIIALVIAIANLALVPTGIRMFESRGLAIAVVAVLCGATYLALAFTGQAIHRHEKLARVRGQVFIFDSVGQFVLRSGAWHGPYELNTTALFTMSPHVATIAKQFSRTIVIARSF